jgi:hypothetical protein
MVQSLRVLRLLPPLKLVAMHDIAEILLKVALNTKNQSYFSNIVAVILWKAPRPVVECITLYQVYLGMTPTQNFDIGNYYIGRHESYSFTTAFKLA